MSLTEKEVNDIIESSSNLDEEITENIKQNRLIMARVPLTVEDFLSILKEDFEDFDPLYFEQIEPDFMNDIKNWCNTLNSIRNAYLRTEDNKYWKLFWDLIPVGYIYCA